MYLNVMLNWALVSAFMNAEILRWADSPVVVVYIGQLLARCQHFSMLQCRVLANYEGLRILIVNRCREK